MSVPIHHVSQGNKPWAWPGWIHDELCQDESCGWSGCPVAKRAHRRRWAALRKQLLPAPCHYCGDSANELDHVQPESRGGADDLTNLVPACHHCNMEKLDFTIEEWRAWREEHGYGWPPKPRWMVVGGIASEILERNARPEG